MTKNILITCVGGFFIYDFIKSIKVDKKNKFNIIGIDVDDKAYSKVLVDKFYSPNGNKREFRIFLWR